MIKVMLLVMALVGTGMTNTTTTTHVVADKGYCYEETWVTIRFNHPALEVYNV